MNFSPADEERMKHIENELARKCNEFRENTEAAIVVFALLRVARTLLKLYRKKTRETLLEDVGIPFLRGQTQPGRLIDGDVGGSLIN